MKTLTIRQPHASLIAVGAKHYETCSWKTDYRGLLAIHAAKRWTKEQARHALYLAQHHTLAQQVVASDMLPPPLGVVLGLCQLVAVHRTEDIRNHLSAAERAFGDFSDGRYAWELNVTSVYKTPIPARGKRGLWEWEPPVTTPTHHWIRPQPKHPIPHTLADLMLSPNPHDTRLGFLIRIDLAKREHTACVPTTPPLAPAAERMLTAMHGLSLEYDDMACRDSLEDFDIEWQQK